MPNPTINAPKPGQIKATTSAQPATTDGAIISQAGGKIKTIKFTDVKDKRAQSLKNDSSITGEVVNNLDGFQGQGTTVDTFDIRKYRSVGNVDVCAAHLSNSLELKKKLNQQQILEIPLAKEYKLVVVSGIQSTDLENVVSFGRACAIMAYQVLLRIHNEEYNWETQKYETVVSGKPALLPAEKYINRLAGQMGMQPGNAYYFLVVPGYEHLYDVFPAEVVALTMARLSHRAQLNIPDQFDDSEIVNALVSKMNKRHPLVTNSIPKILNIIGLKSISMMYESFIQNIGVSSRTIRNTEAAGKFKEIIEYLKKGEITEGSQLPFN